MSTNVSGQVTASQMRPVILASMLGTAIEWYDFFLYGTMATLVFPKLFFPETNVFVGTLLSFVTFLVGFIARPFGGALFGHLGDRIGRKATLIATLLLMGISTLLIGFLPTYASIGVAAAIILTLLRLCQGLGVGGEWGGSVLLALEYGHRRNRGFWASWPQMGVPVGLIASTIIVNIVQATSGSNFAVGAWYAGWRIPFFISALLIIVGLYIRLRIFETPLFTMVKEKKQDTRTPIIDAFRHSTKEILLSAGARFVEQAPFYLFTVFVITYGTSAVIHLERGVVLNAITIGAVIELFTIPFFSYMSDLVGRRLWYLISCVLMAAFAFPYFMLMNSANAVIFSIGVILSICVFHAWVYGPQAALIAERFGTKERYSAASMGYQLAAPFAGGLAPIIALLLLKGETNLSALGLSHTTVSIGTGSWQNVSIYMIVLALISFLCVLWLKDLTKVDISNPEAYNITGEAEEVVLVGED